MKIGIIVHSHTGNTLSVAERLKDVLTLEGHSVNLEQVVAFDENPSAATNVQLKIIPDVMGYDVLIFGAPVRAFSLSQVMKTYLLKVPSLDGKKVGCFVTQHFPYEWMGGKNSISQMKKLCSDKQANVFATGIVNWTNKEREKKISDLLEKLKKF